MTLRSTYLSLLHKHQDPFEGFVPPSERLGDFSGIFGGGSGIFAKLIEELRPGSIFEIGSWIGSSAISMAKALDNLGIDGVQILCIDTWLGYPEWRTYWGNGKEETWMGHTLRSMDLKNGYPRMYDHFIDNIIRAGVQSRIVPFPSDSVSAAKFLQINRLEADLIYVDGSHEYEAVMFDVSQYWKILSGRGVMFGDDYADNHWPGVTKAVDEFASASGVSLTVDRFGHNAYWILRRK